MSDIRFETLVPEKLHHNGSANVVVTTSINNMNTKNNTKALTVLTVPQIAYRILELLPVSDLCHLAQVCRKLKSIVYDETLWVDKLVSMGLDGNVIVKKHIDDKPPNQPAGPQNSADLLLLDLADTSLDDNKNNNTTLTEIHAYDACDNFQYELGQARTAFAKLYKCLAPLYHDLTRYQSREHSEPLVFREFRDPLIQAKVLKQLVTFSRSETCEDERQDRLSTLMTTVELLKNAALHEYELAIDHDDHAVMKKYISVLSTLDDGDADACVQLYLQKHIQSSPGQSLDSSSAFYTSATGLNTKEVRAYCSKLTDWLNQSIKSIDEIFSVSVPVAVPLIEEVLDRDVIKPFTSMLDVIYDDGITKYLRAVPAIFNELERFKLQVKPSANSGVGLQRTLDSLIEDHFHPIFKAYVNEELQAFIEYSESQVSTWSRNLNEGEQATEVYLWSSVSRAKDKNDFLSSFKKVIMMPVSAITSSTSHSNSSQSEKSSDSPQPTPSSSSVSLPSISNGSQSQSSVNGNIIGGSSSSGAGGLLNPKKRAVPLPTTELDAMVAVMDSKLENIKTLFSLELAINLIRAGKESIERIARFSSVKGVTGKEAREKGEEVFVALVDILGGRHILGGFDKALDTLNNYDPKKYRNIVTSKDDEEGEEAAVEPLAIFAELVNIGDLIQQMVHVFYEEELVARRFVDTSSFLSPAIKTKKRFEQDLDNSVANGLSRGIDVLIDQIDFIFITQQLDSDFNPPPSIATTDIGPTDAAKKVVILLRSHMNLLAGSTDKSVIDVFQQEVGLRFFGSICKHIKRKTISTHGAIWLISDLNFYYGYIESLKQKDILPYFEALKELGQLFLIDGSDAKSIGHALSDMTRFRGVMKPDELLEFVQCRKDWSAIKRDVERVMYGFGECSVM